MNNKTAIAEHYRNKSVAEQNSLDVAWDLLMDDAYADLCACIFTNETELQHFRQIVVNVSFLVWLFPPAWIPFPHHLAFDFVLRRRYLLQIFAMLS